MIIYDKLMKILEEREIKKGEFSEAIDIKANTMSALSKNRNVNISTIDKICSYLNCQPGDILEYIDDSEYKKRNEDKISREKLVIEAQIAELQAKLKKLS